MSTSATAANTLPPAVGNQIIQKLLCQAHLCYPSSSKAAVAQELRLDPLVVRYNYSHLNGLLCSKDNRLVQKWNPTELYLSGNFIHIEYR